MRPKRWQILVVLLTIVLAAYSGLSYRFFVKPSTDTPEKVDALVVLSGAADRLPRALELLRDGVSKTLIVSWGPDLSDGQRAEIGAISPPVELLEFIPEPDTTQGEARAIASLMRQRGFSSILVVTSTYHITRARTLVDRCTSARVSWVESRPESSVFGWIARIVHESGGMAWAAVSRSC